MHGVSLFQWMWVCIALVSVTIQNVLGDVNPGGACSSPPAVLTDVPGEIELGGVNGNVGERTCTWHVDASEPVGDGIEVQMSWIALDAGLSCTYASLRLYEDENGAMGQEVAVLCGYQAPSEPISINSSSFWAVMDVQPTASTCGGFGLEYSWAHNASASPLPSASPTPTPSPSPSSNASVVSPSPQPSGGPDDCVLGEWGPWGNCSETCGGVGVMQRMREVLQPQMSTSGRSCVEVGGGSSLEEVLVEEQECAPESCGKKPTPLPPSRENGDCVLSDSYQWSGCSGVCEDMEGWNFGVKSVVLPRWDLGRSGGAVCESTLKKKKCNRNKPCAPPIYDDDAAWQPDDLPTACSSPTIITNSNGHIDVGKPVGTRRRRRNRRLEEVEESVSASYTLGSMVSSMWNAIETMVLGERQNRYLGGLDVDQDVECVWVVEGGEEEEVDVLVEWVGLEGEGCDDAGLPVEGEDGAWMALSSSRSDGESEEVVRVCGVSEEGGGGGVMPSFRRVIQRHSAIITLFLPANSALPAEGRGFHLHYAVNHIGPEPVNCTVGEWGEWGKCDVACGKGHQTRTRNITREAANGGVCPYELEEVRKCNNGPCPPNDDDDDDDDSGGPADVDCEMSPFTPTGECVPTVPGATCGPGKQTEERHVVTPASGNGTPCPTDMERQVNCSLGSCLPDACDPTKQPQVLELKDGKQVTVAVDDLEPNHFCEWSVVVEKEWQEVGVWVETMDVGCDDFEGLGIGGGGGGGGPYCGPFPPTNLKFPGINVSQPSPQSPIPLSLTTKSHPATIQFHVVPRLSHTPPAPPSTFSTASLPLRFKHGYSGDAKSLATAITAELISSLNLHPTRVAVPPESISFESPCVGDEGELPSAPLLCGGFTAKVLLFASLSIPGETVYPSSDITTTLYPALFPSSGAPSSTLPPSSPFQSQPLLSLLDPSATGHLSFSDPSEITLDPDHLSHALPASARGNGNEVALEFVINNDGGSELVVFGVNVDGSPGGPSPHWLQLTTTFPISIDAHSSATVHLDIVPRAISSSRTEPLVAVVDLDHSDPYGEHAVSVLVTILSPSPGASPSPSPSPKSSSPKDPSSLPPTTLIGATAGGTLLVVCLLATLVYCARRCCCSSKTPSKRSGVGSGSGSTTSSSSSSTKTVASAKKPKFSIGDDDDIVDDGDVGLRETEMTGLRDGGRKSGATGGDWGRLSVSDDEEEGRGKKSGTSSSSSSSRRSEGGGRGGGEGGGKGGRYHNPSPSPPPPSSPSPSPTSSSSLHLIASPALRDAGEFEERWGASATIDLWGAQVNVAAVRGVPPSEAIESALKKLHVLCIASGDVAGTTKQYFFAQDASKHTFLAEISVTQATGRISALFKGPEGMDEEGEAFVRMIQKKIRPILQDE